LKWAAKVYRGRKLNKLFVGKSFLREIMLVLVAARPGRGKPWGPFLTLSQYIQSDLTMCRILQFAVAFTLLFFLAACQSGPDAERASTEQAIESMGNPQSLPLEKEPVEQDQIEFTRNVDPSTVRDENLPVPFAEDTDVNADGDMKGKSAKDIKKAVMVGTRSASKAPAGQPSSKTSGANTPATTPPVSSTASSPTSAAPAAAPTTSTQSASTQAPNHSAWNALLQKFVTAQGKVDYAGFKKSESELDAYLATLKESALEKDWGRDAAMAYWINAYNAFTIKRILNDYPVTSIQDLDGGDPWKVKWIDIDGKMYSLNNIEHDILRPQYKDPRIHFAVNCAARSCPPLPNKAFTASNLNQMLESNARAFIRNTDYNTTTGNVRISKIFDWYGEDFGNLKTYLNKYLATPIAEGKEIGFKEYDWALNKQ